jgi:hypothetical protein
MTDPSVMSGTLRLMADGRLVGEMVDVFHYITRIEGVRTGAGVWAISATVVVPEGLKIAWLDDPP